MKSRIVFDHAEESIPYDLDGHLMDWQWVGSGAGAVPRMGHRWPGRSWSSSAPDGGYNGVDHANLFHGRGGLTIRMLCTPDLAENQVMSLCGRGEDGPETYRKWVYRFGMVVQSSGIVLGASTYDAGVESYTDVPLGMTGRPPSETVLLLSIVIDGNTVMAFVNGAQLQPPAIIPALIHTTDTPMWFGHTYRTGGVSADPFRGTIEYIEVEDSAGTARSEALAYERILIEPEQTADDIAMLSPIQGPNWHAYRIRPLADLVADTRAEILRLQRAALAPHCYGDLLATHEAALNIIPEPGQTVAERQLILHQASQIPLGHRPADLVLFAADLFDVPAGEVTLIENKNHREVHTRGTASTAIEDYWIPRLGPGAAELTPEGLDIHVPANTQLDAVNGCHLYIATDFDPSRGKREVRFRGRITPVLPPSRTRYGFCWGYQGIQNWVEVYEEDNEWRLIVELDAYELHTPNLIDRSHFELDLHLDNDTMTIRVIQDDDIKYTAVQPSQPTDRIGVGIRGQARGLDSHARFSQVHLFEPDNEVNYNAAAYHPAPKRRRTERHTHLLTAHGDAATVVTAQTQRYVTIGVSPIGFTLVRTPKPGAL